ncbi:nucleotidyltransferase domain-containing protein [Micromonospora aurantiaca]|uniref:nucleotidyltransferase domain-containing protein n=1 Tax=Micromonospora aurantiaca (nom. illeg.) TaxID=47850 RepID=UPI0038102C89
MAASPAVVADLGDELRGLGWVSDLMVAGSLATGDYVPGVSDLDLVALVDGPVDAARQAALVTIHRSLDSGSAAGFKLGCVYVDAATIPDLDLRHPTWTHGRLVHRVLSRVTRAELGRHGYEVFGRAPRDVFPEVSADDIRAAARAELTGYWAWAARRPWLWLAPTIAELGLTSMARGRHALREGMLLTKTQAISQAHAPAWLIDRLAARRRGEDTTSPPRIRTAFVAWRDARRTVAHARRAR